jgi:hypothetical protein
MATSPWNADEQGELSHFLSRLSTHIKCELTDSLPNAMCLWIMIRTGRIRADGLTVLAIQELRELARTVRTYVAFESPL